MPLRWQEVAVPLIIISLLLLLKHVPFAAGLPLARTAGVVAFFYAAFLALRLLQGEDALRIDGWSELRPSPMEYFACYGAAALAVVLMSAVIVIGGTRHVPATQMIATFLAALLLGGGALGIGLGGLFARVRWNHNLLEYQSAFGRKTTLAWSEVRAVTPNWRGITIVAHDARRVTFSQFHAGAAQLARHASNRAHRNARLSAEAATSL